ncbi:MAG: glycosyl hydrolase, partial [Muribaculaceae bacterium]|nr:glycosyl hydrolase [Muribaculaceae bacterium]
WNDVQGYKHAYAPADEEAAAEATAKAYTEAQKAAVANLKLWDLYDAVAQAPNAKAKAKAQKAYDKALAKYNKLVK